MILGWHIIKTNRFLLYRKKRIEHILGCFKTFFFLLVLNSSLNAGCLSENLSTQKKSFSLNKFGMGWIKSYLNTGIKKTLSQKLRQKLELNYTCIRLDSNVVRGGWSAILLKVKE